MTKGSMEMGLGMEGSGDWIDKIIKWTYWKVIVFYFWN